MKGGQYVISYCPPYFFLKSDEFRKEKAMEKILDLEWIKKEFENVEPEEDIWNDGELKKSIYLGSCFSLSPSGKYYTPWANSNVEACEACAKAMDAPCDKTSPCIPPDDWEGEEGEEYHCEVCKDAAFYKQLDEEAESIGAWIESGEGDPCDIFICIHVDKEEEEDDN